MENTNLKVMMPKVAIVEQLNWKLYDAGDYKQYDGLTELFVKLVEADRELLKDTNIKRWYRLSVEANHTGGNV